MNRIIRTISMLIVASVFLSCTTSDAQTKTATFKVWGNCNMCKKTIEKAADTKGVVKASWSPETGLMKVTYDTLQIQLTTIQQNIAKSGYDNEAFSGDDVAYKALPECCQYDRNKK